MQALHEGDIGPFKGVPAFENASVNLASTGHLADEHDLATVYTSNHAFLIPENALLSILERYSPVAERKGPGDLYITDQGPRWFTQPSFSVDDPFGHAG